MNKFIEQLEDRKLFATNPWQPVFPNPQPTWNNAPLAMPQNQNVNFGTLYDAIGWQESKWNTRAFNARENAIGILQIRLGVIIDVNEYLNPAFVRRVNGKVVGYDWTKASFVHADAWKVDSSFYIMLVYMDRYGKLYQQNTGKVPTVEVYSRIWNGGPTGYQKAATIQYATNVRRFYNNLAEGRKPDQDQ